MKLTFNISAVLSMLSCLQLKHRGKAVCCVFSSFRNGTECNIFMLHSFGIIIPLITSSLDLYFLARIANKIFVFLLSYESHYISSTYLLGFSLH